MNDTNARIQHVFNDLIDLDADRLHATKFRRPFASGALPVIFGGLRVGVTQAPPWYSKDPKNGEWSTGLGVSMGKAMAAVGYEALRREQAESALSRSSAWTAAGVNGPQCLPNLALK